MIELTCLGPPRVRQDGGAAPAELLWRKHLALLVYLVRSPRGRTREHLIGVLWGGKAEARARHSLNEALRVLRRSLGDGLRSEGTTVHVAPGAVETDVDELTPARVGGEFLEGFSVPDAPEFEDWLARERAQLRVASLGVLVAAADRALCEGAPAAARAWADRALRLDPLHEPAVRVAMRAQALAGSRAGAMQAFEGLREALHRDLGIEPAKETRDLADRIRTERVVRGAPAAPEAPERPPVLGGGRTLLVRLTALWRRACGGEEKQVAVLRGDPGTGKTLLLSELAAQARLDGGAVGYARALEGDGVHGVLGALLRGGLSGPDLGGAAPPALAALLDLDPDLAARFPAARSAEPLPLADAWLAAVAAAADARPVLLALDDAQDADPGLFPFLLGAVERTPGRRLMLAVAAAAQPAVAAVDRLTERVGRDVAGAVLATDVLTQEDARELVTGLFPEYDAAGADRLARRVMADTAGNPFLAVELAAAIRAGLRVEHDAEAPWPAAHRTLDQTLPSDLPGSVAAALRLRYKNLSVGAQAALAAVAVLGGTMPPAALGRAAGLDPQALDRALDELEWQRWLVGDAHGYRFVTRLARDVILADMVTAGQRRRMRDLADPPS